MSNGRVVDYLDSFYNLILFMYLDIEGFQIHRDQMTGAIYYTNRELPEVFVYVTPMMVANSTGSSEGVKFGTIDVSIGYADDSVDYEVMANMVGDYDVANRSDLATNVAAYFQKLVPILATVKAMRKLASN